MHACTTHQPHPLCIYPISGVHILIHPITHVHPPSHPIMHARTNLNHYARTHPPMCVPTYPIHPTMHARMHARTCPNHQRCTPTHPLWYVYTLPSDHTCMHAIIQAVLICAPAAPDTGMLTVYAEPSPQSSVLYPAALELRSVLLKSLASN